jgi:hypothetical protein
MPKLNQIIAISAGKKSAAQKALTEAYQQLQKSALLESLSRTYKPRDDEGERLPPEGKQVQLKVREAVRTVRAAEDRGGGAQVRVRKDVSGVRCDQAVAASPTAGRGRAASARWAIAAPARPQEVKAANAAKPTCVHWRSPNSTAGRPSIANAAKQRPAMTNIAAEHASANHQPKRSWASSVVSSVSRSTGQRAVGKKGIRDSPFWEGVRGDVRICPSSGGCRPGVHI